MAFVMFALRQLNIDISSIPLAKVGRNSRKSVYSVLLLITDMYNQLQQYSPRLVSEIRETNLCYRNCLEFMSRYRSCLHPYVPHES